MDDLILNSKSNLLNLKGKDWSSLQNLDSEDSEESDLNYHQNGYLNLNSNVNGEFSDKYTSTNSSDDSCLPVRKHCDTSKLNREDMCIYGLRPAYDQFYLVVCEFCKKVVKPQALSKHIETRHSSTSTITKSNDEINLLNVDNTELKDDNNSLIEDDSNKSDNIRISNSLLSSSLAKDDLHLERLKQKPNLSTKLKSTTFKGLDSKSNSSNNSTASSPLTDNLSSKNVKPKLVKPKLLPCKDRKYDPNKHCGVKLVEGASPCTRSLTCKTHSLTLRRQVPDRSDSFDKLLADHRLAKEAALRAAGIEVKPTKLQLKQQQRLQKNNQLKEQQQKEQNNKVNNNISSAINSVIGNPLNSGLQTSATTSFNNQQTQPIQLKIHLQSPNSSLNSSFNAFNQLHQNETTNLNVSTSNGQNVTTNYTALPSPNSSNSFVNINNLQFTSPSPTIKQFTFGNNQQLAKLLASPSRTTLKTNLNNHQFNQGTSLLPSSIQVINQTNLMNSNHLTHNQSNKQQITISRSNSSQSETSIKKYTNSLINNNKPFNCDIKPATLSYYPKPAAVCSFNERRLSIYTQSSNKKILSSKLFNRKQDYTYSALSILCNKEKVINNNQTADQLSSPIRHLSVNKSSKANKSDHNSLQNMNSNSQTSNCSIASSGRGTTVDYLSSGNSQESNQNFSSIFNQQKQQSKISDKNGLSISNDHPITKSFCNLNNNKPTNSSIVTSTDLSKNQINLL